MGWNSLHLQNDGRLFKGIPEETYVYFVHSYYLQAKDLNREGDCAVWRNYSCLPLKRTTYLPAQFHPEKSSKYGLKILENFAKLGRRHNYVTKRIIPCLDVKEGM